MVLESAERVNALCGNTIPIALNPNRGLDHSGPRCAATDKARDKLCLIVKIGYQETLWRNIAWTCDDPEPILRCIMQHVCFVPRGEPLPSTHRPLIA